VYVFSAAGAVAEKVTLSVPLGQSSPAGSAGAVRSIVLTPRLAAHTAPEQLPAAVVVAARVSGSMTNPRGTPICADWALSSEFGLFVIAIV